MLENHQIIARGDALSVLGWWNLAGVDSIVDDAPRDWLAGPRRAQPAAVVDEPTRAALPATLAAMTSYLESCDVPGAGGDLLLPQGDPASGLMLLVDMPEAAGENGTLLHGELGALFERMMAAIGRDRASLYLAPLLPRRPLGGRAGPAVEAEFGRIALQHAALAAPRALLLLGEAASRAILGTTLAEARGRTHQINHRGVNFVVVATFHPRLLLQNPARKADAWRDLQLLIKEIGR